MAVQATLLPFLLRWGFAVLGVARATGLLSAWARRSSNPHGEERAVVLSQAVRVQKIVKASLGVGGTCLVRSLVLQAILRKRGVATDLRIGIRKQGNAPEGHAWLEYQQTPLNESVEEVATYAVFEGAGALDSWRVLK